ncbi:hypothetical protein LTR60_003844, partial [Cryomyces antarcticus]
MGLGQNVEADRRARRDRITVTIMRVGMARTFGCIRIITRMDRMSRKPKPRIHHSVQKQSTTHLHLKRSELEITRQWPRYLVGRGKWRLDAGESEKPNGGAGRTTFVIKSP